MKLKSIKLSSELLKEKHKDLPGRIAIMIISALSVLILAALSSVLIKIFIEGASVINLNFLSETPRNSMTEGGIGPAIIGTLSVSFIMIIFAVPMGIFSAIYIHEYAREKWYSRILKLSVNNLAGVPSIVFGLFGLGFFVLIVGKFLDEIMDTGLLFGQPVMLWASATLAVLVLPTIILTTIEALAAVPDHQRYASYGLGATKWQTIRDVIFPQARPGILTGVILAISRAAGETAPVLFLGCAFFLPELPLVYFDFGFFEIPMINPASQFMYLSYHIFILTTQSANPTLTQPIQYGTTTVLILLTVILNLTAILFRYKFRKTLREVRGA